MTPRRRSGDNRLEEVAGEGSRAVAVASVVDREEDAVAEVVRHEGAVEGDCEGLLGDPALPE